jgi:hypothetical protein
MNINDLSGIAISFVVIAVVLGIGSTILGSVRSSGCSGGTTYLNATSGLCYNQTTGGLADTAWHQVESVAWNASTGGLAGLNTISSWQVTLAIIVVAAVVIGVISLFQRSE